MAILTYPDPPISTIALSTRPRANYFYHNGDVFVVLTSPAGGNMAVARVSDGAVISLAETTQVYAMNLLSADLEFSAS